MEKRRSKFPNRSAKEKSRGRALRPFRFNRRGFGDEFTLPPPPGGMGGIRSGRGVSFYRAEILSASDLAALLRCKGMKDLALTSNPLLSGPTQGMDKVPRLFFGTVTLNRNINS